MDEALKGDIDLIVALLINDKRKEDFLFTKPWVMDTYSLVMDKNNHLKFSSFKDLDGLLGGYLKGVSLPSPFREFVKDNKSITAIPKIPLLFKLLNTGRMDYLIVSQDSFFAVIPPAFKKEDFIVIKGSEVEIPVYMAFSKNSRCTPYFERIDAYFKQHPIK